MNQSETAISSHPLIPMNPQTEFISFPAIDALFSRHRLRLSSDHTSERESDGSAISFPVAIRLQGRTSGGKGSPGVG